MKAYLITTGVIFGLMVVMHIWRIVSESHSLASDPWFILITLISAALCGWSVSLLRKSVAT
jgi:hypothetical protein